MLSSPQSAVLSLQLLTEIVCGGLPMRLRNRVALVTGAGMGIGRATALLFAQEGARVIAADVNEEAGTATAQAIRDAGGDSLFQRTDVSAEADVASIVQAGSSRFGAI